MAQIDQPLNDPINKVEDQNATTSGFSLVDNYRGYRHREDITNLPPGYLIPGSLNVLSNSAERISIRKGYTLDGQANTVDEGVPILSAYDWFMHIGQERHTRSWDDRLEYRYVYPDGTVEWRLLDDGYNAVPIRYAEFWNVREQSDFLLYVDGSSNIFEWSGGITTFASATASTITKEGTTTWGEENFYIATVSEAQITIINFSGLSGDTVAINVNGTVTTLTEGVNWTAGTDNATTATSLATAIDAVTGLNAVATGAVITVVVAGTASIDNIVISDSTNMSRTPNSYPPKQVVIDGVTYTYTGGVGTTTLTGVTPDPTLAGHAVGAVIHQAPRTFTNATSQGIPSTFTNNYIATLYNQIYIGSDISREVYISNVNTFIDFTFDAPRLPGQGALLTLDGVNRGLIPQEDSMYIFGSRNQIYKTKLTLSGDLLYETLTIERLKTSAQQGAQSQELIAKVKNNVVFVTYEPKLDEIGRVENIFGTPQTTTLSDPIENDFIYYNFEDGQVFYFGDAIYIAIPKQNRVLIYNMYKRYWEAPQTIPVSRFSIINGELYGHSYQSPQTFKLFDGYTDNGQAYKARVQFSYQNFGDRALLKNFNRFYVEGYIQSNTKLKLQITYEIDGCKTETQYVINGTDRQIVCIGGDDGSLGKQSLGKKSLAGKGPTISDNLPPKFRVIKTFPRLDFFEMTVAFETDSEEQRWEILAFGPEVMSAEKEPVFISQ